MNSVRIALALAIIGLALTSCVAARDVPESARIDKLSSLTLIAEGAYPSGTEAPATYWLYAGDESFADIRPRVAAALHSLGWGVFPTESDSRAAYDLAGVHPNRDYCVGYSPYPPPPGVLAAGRLLQLDNETRSKLALHADAVIVILSNCG
jgi:hypothetical protein